MCNVLSRQGRRLWRNNRFNPDMGTTQHSTASEHVRGMWLCLTTPRWTHVCMHYHKLLIHLSMWVDTCYCQIVEEDWPNQRPHHENGHQEMQRYQILSPCDDVLLLPDIIDRLWHQFLSSLGSLYSRQNVEAQGAALLWYQGLKDCAAHQIQRIWTLQDCMDKECQWICHKQ